MKKKIGIGLLIVGVIMILIPLLLPGNPKVEEVEWKVVIDSKTNNLIVDEDIICNCNSYNTENYLKEYFNSVESNKNKYWFLVPKENVLTRTANYGINYNGIVSVNYSNTSIEDLSSYLIERINDYDRDYNKFYIRKKDINNDTFAIIFKAMSKDNTNYFEELTIYSYNTENNYSFVKYQTNNNTMSDEFISRVISGFIVEGNKAENTVCKDVNNQYSCNININTIGKKIEFIVDKTKYTIETEQGLDNYEEVFFDTGMNYNISVSFILSDTLQEEIKNSDRFDQYEYIETSINEIKTNKYYKISDVGYSAYYITELDNNLAFVVYIDSSTNNLDEIMKDFSNFKLINN